MTNKYQGLNAANCDVIVEHNTELQQLPYTVRKMNAWGLSDGTLSASDFIAKDDTYTLTEQVDGANIYTSKNR